MNEGDWVWPANPGDDLWRELMDHALHCCGTPGGYCRGVESCAWKKSTERQIECAVDNYRRHGPYNRSTPGRLTWAQFKSEVRLLRDSLDQARKSLEKIASHLGFIYTRMQATRGAILDRGRKRGRFYKNYAVLLKWQVKRLDRALSFVSAIDHKGGPDDAGDIINQIIYGRKVRWNHKYELINDCLDIFMLQGMKYPSTTEGGDFEEFCNAVYDLAEGRACASEDSGLQRGIKKVIKKYSRTKGDWRQRVEENKRAMQNMKERCDCGMPPPPFVMRIRSLNDAFRINRQGGKVFLSPAVTAKGDAFKEAALRSVAEFDGFTEEHDHLGQHDAGLVNVDGERLFFRIDYEDRNTGERSFDPADTEKTRRVMTILLAEEWGL